MPDCAKTTHSTLWDECQARDNLGDARGRRMGGDAQYAQRRLPKAYEDFRREFQGTADLRPPPPLRNATGPLGMTLGRKPRALLAVNQHRANCLRYEQRRARIWALLHPETSEAKS